jgi:hypothetical protein
VGGGIIIAAVGITTIIVTVAGGITTIIVIAAGSGNLKEKAPARGRGFCFIAIGECYIFGLQVLLVASHIPPALVHAAFVFAVVTSAAKVGAAMQAQAPVQRSSKRTSSLVHLLSDTTTLLVAPHC